MMSNKKIVMIAPIRTLSGYGARSRDLGIALIELGYDIQFIAVPWGSTPHTGLDLTNPKHQMIHERIISNLTFKPDICIHCVIPPEFNPVGEFNIGITAGIETTVCRPEWLEGCNRMDLVLVSSEHAKNVFEHAQFEKKDTKTQQLIDVLKMKVPCEVLFEGVDTNVYKRKKCDSERINSFMKQVPEEFAFLQCGQWLQGDLGHDRKDIGMLIYTFMNIFKRKSPKNRPALILKTSHANFSNLELLSIRHKIQSIMDLVKEQQQFEGDLPSVYLLHGELSDEEMNCLYNHDKVKAMITFTKGEGYGRPLLEFTMTGKPVIAPSWSGQLDFLNPEFSFLLPGQVQQVHPSACNEWIMREGGWFTVNYTYAAQIMEMMPKMYDKYLEKSKKHINITKNNFSIEAMKDRLSLILSKIDEYKDIKETAQPAMEEFKVPQIIKERQ